MLLRSIFLKGAGARKQERRAFVHQAGQAADAARLGVQAPFERGESPGLHPAVVPSIPGQKQGPFAKHRETGYFEGILSTFCKICSKVQEQYFIYRNSLYHDIHFILLSIPGTMVKSAEKIDYMIY